MTPTDHQLSDKLPGRRVRISSAREAEILTNFRLDLKHSSQGKMERTERALRALKAFRAWSEKKSGSPYLTDVYVPVVFSSIMTKVAAEYEAIAKAPPLIGCQAEKADDDDVADLFDALIGYHLGVRNYKPAILEVLLSKAIFGHTWVYTWWREEYREVADWGDIHTVTQDFGIDPNTGQVGPVQRTESSRVILPSMVKTIDAPWFDNIHFLNAFPDWSVSVDNFQDSRYFICLQMRSPEYVRSRFKSKAWSHPLQAEILNGSDWSEYGYGDTDTQESIRTWQRTMGLISGQLGDSAEGNQYEVGEYMTPNGVATVLNRRWVVCYRKGWPLGRYPVISLPNHIVPGEPFGISDFEIIDKLNANVQHMANSSATEALLNAFPMMRVAPGVDTRALSVGPGKWIPTATKDDVSFIVRPNSGIEVADRQVANGLRMIDEGLGISETVRGALPSRDVSATAVSQSVMSTSRRNFLNIELINSLFLRQLGLNYRDMIRLMQSEELVLRLQRDGSNVRVDLNRLIDARIEIIPQANASALREIERKQLLDFLTIVSNYQIQSVDKEEIARIIAKSMIPKYTAQVVRTAQQMAQAQAEAAKFAAAQQAESQGGGQQPQGSPPPSSGRVFDQSNGMNQEGASTQNV